MAATRRRVDCDAAMRAPETSKDDVRATAQKQLTRDGQFSRLRSVASCQLSLSVRPGASAPRSPFVRARGRTHAHLFDLDDMHVGFRRAARAAATQVRFPPAS